MTTIQNNLVDRGVSPTVRVRGLRAPLAAPVHHCLHCGASLVASATRESDFCCAGCSYVFRLVHEQGLDSYYKIRDAVIAPASPGIFQPRDFTWLATLQETAEQSSAAPELNLEIQGISCAACVWLIERLFNRQPGSLHIETDAQLGRLHLRWTPGEFDAPAFARTLQSFNYLVGPPGAQPLVSESRQLVRRIGLCAAFSMNVMLFTLPVYFGMREDFAYAGLFGLLSLVFATFSVLTGGIYFINRAVRALRDGVMHIDLPIAVGIVGSYLGSLYGWLTGQGELVYFDFVSAFILLMLTGRWAQTAAIERNRHRLLVTAAQVHRVLVETPQGKVTRSAEDLVTGEKFLVSSGQAIPVDSRLESPAATVGTAWINGEADAHERREGALIPAGAINLTHGEIRLRAAQPWSASLLAQLLRPARRDDYRHAFLERVIRGYLVGIFGAAILAGLGWWFGTHDAARTWAVVTAVLVVSCPCAIGLAFPLTDEMAAVALQRCGVFIRENDLWPRLARIRKIIFDKTGTLTAEIPVLQNPDALAALAPEARAALLALVRDNPHPVSQCLAENLLSSGLATGISPPVGEIHEEIGHGLSLKTPQKIWSLRRPDNPTRHLIGDVSIEGHDAEFACDGVVLARFRFADEMRPGAPAEIAALRTRGFELYILSGDRPAKVQSMAAELGLPADHAIAGVTPSEKAAWVQSLDRRDTLMLGDGANDSLAFDAAFARGTPAVHRGVLEGKSDFYYLGPGLGGLREMLAVAALRRRTQFALLIFSIVYNLIAVGLAAAGHMNPLLAAILMPVSSVAMLAITHLGMRPPRTKNCRAIIRHIEYYPKIPRGRARTPLRAECHL